ncbi:hypothetical protein MTR_2g025315 [Medicago truncatula]|uniref:Uncharacterized protein n=1 Tax=Medicago truncatula TaxID=3880 RepID=A0A072V6H7_MEDTR|nr:hypothetical protein MTR_2g025315 [Medicago truncatula]
MSSLVTTCARTKERRLAKVSYGSVAASTMTDASKQFPMDNIQQPNNISKEA